jgi:hypothetical protein
MRELAIILGESAAKLNDDETGLIIKKELRNGKGVAVIYLVGENVERVVKADEPTPEPTPEPAPEPATPEPTPTPEPEPKEVAPEASS